MPDYTCLKCNEPMESTDESTERWVTIYRCPKCGCNISVDFSGDDFPGEDN